MDRTREVLLKGKGKYSWPPCTYEFRSAPFILKILVTIFTKQVASMRRSIVLSLPPLLAFPGRIVYKSQQGNRGVKLNLLFQKVL